MQSLVNSLKGSDWIETTANMVFSPDNNTTSAIWKLVHTLRLVDKLVSADPGGGWVPGHPEAGVPLIRNAEVPGAEHSHCRKQHSQHSRSFEFQCIQFGNLSAMYLLYCSYKTIINRLK